MAAAAQRCMNAVCGAAAPPQGGEWRKGWPLRSGGYAALCDKCGMAYEQLVFCDIFHQKESGWRECAFCGKRLHCGCIASKFSFDLLDTGGVHCISCMKNSGLSLIPSKIVPKFMPPHEYQRLFGLYPRNLKDESVPGSSFSADDKIDDTAKKNFEAGQSSMILKPREIENGTGPIKWEHINPFLRRSQNSIGSSQSTQQDDSKDTDNVACESLTKACLSMSLGISNSGSKFETTLNIERNIMLPPPSAIAEGSDLSKKLYPFQQVERGRHFLHKPPKTGPGLGVACDNTAKDVVPLRVARPPIEGRGRNQLLPRYWPRITDQELQQISGDANSTIVPLFEKVLSASDAGRIGRLVLPKACAEAYFPPISQPEGRPLTIQDAKGKEWHFQFRYWPNNNSRMYVLEGVTPCIQSLQLQAGDTVTFSRIEPEGKLVMGFRKATNTVTLQDSQISAIANGSFVSDTFFSGANENFPIVSGFSGLLQSVKGTADFHSGSLSERLSSADGDASWLKAEMFGGRPNEDLSFQPLQKRSRNIGAKSRRLLMDNLDALELKLTWEEAQDLLRPAPSAKPTVVTIEDHDIEEYEERPVFGKRTIFTVRASGEQDQWIQCDDCSKWRKIPVHVIVASKWTCADNSWDPKSSSCSAPDELNPKELQNILRQYADLKRQRLSGSFKPTNSSDLDTPGLDTLATAATLGEVGNQSGATTCAAPTTRHPRHRPGCSCIVCIQPPSGKGPKHNPACTCNVCMTVKRRFKTLMMRKKKRQSEREEAEANTSNKKIGWSNKEEFEGSNPFRVENDLGADYSRSIIEKLEASKGRIDLNCHPGRSEDQQVGQSRPPSMMSLLQVANRPLENYLKQNGLTSLACEQASSSTLTVPQATVESEGRTSNEGHRASVDREQDSVVDEGCGNQDKVVVDAT
uniref:B3 domain-containing transcription repressor VAL2 n=1 Tax=Ananas comosus var. bracteatus TaxID=296719 RepID=A0A6V7QFJ7_ANACO|nr:unnamed protein product [Ananas comosus var. bracteatus]